jgi:regulator of sigma E protease
MGGMEAGDFEDPNGFHRKSAWQRILILAAGPAANFLVAIFLFTGLGLTQLNSDPGKVVNVVPGTSAARTGVVVGDRITTVNGKPTSPGYIRKVEDAAPGAPLTLGGVHANGQPFTYIVAPACDTNNRCLIGVGVAPVVTVQSAVTEGVAFPYRAVTEIVTGIWSLITGQVPGGVFGPQGFTGPIGIADVTVGAVNQGPQTYIFLVALLSVALGFTNLLPLLALDGGRVLIVILEVLRRRPFDRASELNFQRVGLATLLGLAAVISFLDIQRIATGQFPGFSH